MSRLVLLGLAAFFVASCAAGDDDGVAGAEDAAPPPSSAPETVAEPASEPLTEDDSSTTTGVAPTDGPGTPPWAPEQLSVGETARWTLEVLEVWSHDPGAYTQGLELADGVVYESTGIRSASTVRAIEPVSGEPTMIVDLAPEVFGEGLTVVDDRVYQLTWQAGVAYVRDRSTLAEVDRFGYDGEGWGLCHDSSRFVMSDGSAVLTFRDTDTFDEIGSVEVRLDGEPVSALNELECVDDHVLANIWKRTEIVVIDPRTGDVVAVIDAADLVTEAVGTVADEDRVLNGIAHYDDDTFVLTGKWWPTMYVVRFVAG